MQGLKSYFSILVFTIPIVFMGCATESPNIGSPVLFNTRAEAEKAAKNFKCTGAHKMGDKWMPCKSHKSHENHGEHVNHHNH